MKQILASLTLVFATACSGAPQPQEQQTAFAYNQAPRIPDGATGGSRCLPYGGINVPACIYTLEELSKLTSAVSIPVLVEGNLRAYNGHLVVSADEPTNSPVFMLNMQQDLSAQDIAVMIGRRVQIAGFYTSSGEPWSQTQQAGLLVVHSLRWL